jgi:hypothetical protein
MIRQVEEGWHCLYPSEEIYVQFVESAFCVVTLNEFSTVCSDTNMLGSEAACLTKLEDSDSAFLL